MRLFRSRAVPACVVAVLVAGCTAGAPERPGASEPQTTLSWSRTTLPDGSRPSLVAPGPPGSVLVAVDGDDFGSAPPRVLQVDDGVRPVPVRPATYYGRRIVWHGLVAAGRAISAFGGRSGGAHGNVRWSAWSGRSGLREEPQPFETFGGPNAGGIAGIAVGAGGPVLVGSRVTEQGSGLDVVLWTHHGSRWVQTDPVGSALAAGHASQPSAHAILARRTGLVVVGSETELADEPRTVPAAWTARTAAGPWTRLELPGARQPVAEALAGACELDGECLLVGSDGGRLVGW